MSSDKELNFAALREERDRWKTLAVELVRRLGPLVVADAVLRCGYHPHRTGWGRAITEHLVLKHQAEAAQADIALPDVSKREIQELADRWGVDRMFEESRGLNL